MASDNGDLEIQEDSLDTAIKSHRRIGPPDDLLDRCLSTIPAPSRLGESQPVVVAPTSPELSRPASSHLVRWALAASILIAVSGAYFFFDYRSRERLSAERVVAQLERAESGPDANFADSDGDGDTLWAPSAATEPADAITREESLKQQLKTLTEAITAVSESHRRERTDYSSEIKELQERGAELQRDYNTARGGGAATEQGISSGKPAEGTTAKRSRRLGSGPADSGKSRAEYDKKLLTKGYVNPAGEAKPGGKAEGHPASAESVGSKGKGNLVSGRGVPQDVADLEQVTGGLKGKAVARTSTSPAESESKEKSAKDGTAHTAIINDQQKNYAELNENYKKARADAAKYAEQARLYGDDATIRAEVEARLIASERAIQSRQEQSESFRIVGPNAETYTAVTDNPFLPVGKCPLSTFSTDVDTASYANVRRFLKQGQMPPRDAVRIEELINYFSYDYPQPKAADPFSVNLEVAGCPWNGEHRLVRIGLKGREIADQQRPPANLVFLVDVSGSMQPANKLPLLKSAMKMLVGRLGENERVAIVTYSHEIRLVLPSTTCDSKETIIQALDGLQAAGSTNGGGGIQMAYSVAVENFIQGGVNRVILATDGDFNVGITDREELTRFIEQKRESGVFLSVLGFGMGNLKDATLERLADKGNGHFAYIDSIDEARKVLVDQLSGTLVTIAKDVKLQIEFNPRTVSAYRLIGYENRVMPAQDFNDDRKDAGDIGAGHTVTALYEIVPAGKGTGLPGTDPLKYQPEEKPVEELRPAPDDGLRGDVRRELLTVKLRYKKPNEHQSLLAEVPVTDSGRRYGEASSDFKFASAVAAFGMILRNSPHRGSATLDGVLELGEDGRGADREGYRSEFLKLVRQAKSLRGQ